RVSNSGNAKREQFQLHWADAAAAAPLDVYVPPGQSRVVAAPVLPTNTTGEKLVLSGDDDEFDNTVYILQPKAEQIRIWFVGDEPEDPSHLFFYLKRAFQQTRRQAVAVTSSPAAVPLSSSNFSEARLVIATGRLPDAQVTALRNFETGGGTVLFVMTN